MNTLFVCNQNENRSKTAEIIFKNIIETRSAGLYNDSPITAKQISWADLIVVMEEHQRGKISELFPDLYLKKRIVSLDIPDVYKFMQNELVTLLQSKMKEIL